MEPLKCVGECDKGDITGIGVVVTPINEDNSLGEPGIMHTTCYDEMMQTLYSLELRGLFNICVGPVHDIWAGLNTETDEEAGIKEN